MYLMMMYKVKTKKPSTLEYKALDQTTLCKTIYFMNLSASSSVATVHRQKAFLSLSLDTHNADLLFLHLDLMVIPSCWLCLMLFQNRIPPVEHQWRLSIGHRNPQHIASHTQ
ncbi:hypothetical protein CFOL_v3_13029 [Cephalotus follicularis]|uniref:Uncharacterized protein n=1 Tax=Cephalotus follicularis TaxID=3775 RepID=A0A1Q3BNQ8_CEPFO|nr:hypothetical protein CFOL_v3_13029 [Cephalotus follicularis]